ncbi:MAG: hypothetical protein IPK16_23995 [Anaerolineales bacterium]|nr:hypothetical protein [Anaerolineales bacterium]
MPIDTLYFIHHSHTDIGYTHDQPTLFDLHERFITTALDLAEKYANSESDGAFRWTVENTYVLSRWLEHASAEQIRRFQTLERAGRIEVTAMFANLTPLLDTDQLIESFQLLRELRDRHGFTITSAMNCDVNGENWPLVDLFADLGIEGFTMAINTHFGGAPLARPDVFKWKGPSGRSVLAYSGWPYDQGYRYGIGRSVEQFEEVWWPRVERRLAEINYPLPVVMAQSFHPFGDNGSAYEGFTTWIDAWNAAGKLPHIKFATPRMWWSAVKEHLDKLPTYRGDWTDFWNFGSVSSAREQATNRQSRARLRAADAIAAPMMAQVQDDPDPWLARTLALYRETAWHNLHLWDEHTWGADHAVREPDVQEVAAQWNHKAHFAYQARSLSLMLQRDAVAALARQVDAAPEDLLLVNPLPWPRTVSVDVPSWVTAPRGTPDDSTAGRQFQDHHAQPLAAPLPQHLGVEGLRTTYAGLRTKRLALPGVELPAYGYKVVSRDQLVEWAYAPGVAEWSPPTSALPRNQRAESPTQMSEEAVVDNGRHRLVFDRERGGVLSWYDLETKREWVDKSADYRFGSFVHEEVANRDHPFARHLMFHMNWDSDLVERPRGWKPGWNFRRRTPTAVRSHHVFTTPHGIEVIQVLDAPGIVGSLVQSVFLPNYAGWVEFRATWHMGLDSHPEATYLVFPFAVPDAVVRFDLGPQALQPEVDQIPGVCFDYFTVQNWVDFSNDQLGVTVATPDNPMIQLGDFHFGDNQVEFNLERPMLLGWVTNNYWETNFRAHQPGEVTALSHPAPRWWL